jgi:hypothetical protein
VKAVAAVNEIGVALPVRSLVELRASAATPRLATVCRKSGDQRACAEPPAPGCRPRSDDVTAVGRDLRVVAAVWTARRGQIRVDSDRRGPRLAAVARLTVPQRRRRLRAFALSCEEVDHIPACVYVEALHAVRTRRRRMRVRVLTRSRRACGRRKRQHDAEDDVNGSDHRSRFQ